jgi:hypothetical protein
MNFTLGSTSSPKNAKAKQKKKKDKENTDPYMKHASSKVYAIFFAVLILPALGLWFRAFSDGLVCEAELQACNDECKTVYASIEMVFMSEGQGRRACYRKCKEEDELCMRSVNILWLCGGLLCASMICSIVGVEFMLCLRQGQMTLTDSASKPRALTQEPVFTEDELEQQATEDMATCEKYIRYATVFCFGCKGPVRGMCMLISQYYGLSPTPDPPTGKISIQCVHCNTKLDVDDRWKTHDRSGMRGANCPSCHKRVLGLL